MSWYRAVVEMVKQLGLDTGLWELDDGPWAMDDGAWAMD